MLETQFELGLIRALDTIQDFLGISPVTQV